MPSAAILGSGSWGTALAVLLAKKGLRVALWGRDPETADAINRTHRNPFYLTDVTLPIWKHAAIWARKVCIWLRSPAECFRSGSNQSSRFGIVM